MSLSTVRWVTKIMVDFVLVGRIDWYLMKPVLKIVTSAAHCAEWLSPSRLLPVWLGILEIFFISLQRLCKGLNPGGQSTVKIRKCQNFNFLGG